ncbi:phage tail tape measure protein [Pantoea sp. 18069]|uniref:phage tail tape measure protein n=1 Tax=Pantoea sp. 18069 TaxID=2681415 RepID=UPI0013590901|nr:phage tail tape measure protein [Pantoea sp. 18069]
MASRSLGTLTLDLIAKIGGFESGMDRAARTAGQKAKQISAAQRKAAKESEEAWNKIGSVIGGIFAGITVGAVFQKFIAETKAAGQEQAQLAAVLKSTGNAAGFSQNRLNEMADSMQDTLGISAGEITQAQTVLSAFTNIVGDKFPAALQVAADHSARTGSEIKASAEIMGRALDVPSVGMASLQKQGFKFSESQIELARELERTGRIAEAQQMVLDSLNETYEGAAAAARDTFGGALKALQNTINGLLTGDSGSMAQMKVSVEGLNSALASEGTRAAFQTLIGWMVDLSTAVIRGTANLVTFINTKNKLSVVMGTDEFGKLKAGADSYSHQLTQLVSKAERFQEALSRNPDDKNTQRMLDNVRTKITEVQGKSAAASQALKDFAEIAAPTASTVMAPDLKLQAPGVVNLKDGDKGGAQKAAQEAAAQARYDIEAVRAKFAEIAKIYGASEKLLEATRRAGLVDESEYYAAKLSFIDLVSTAQEKALQEENERLQAQRLGAKEALDRDRQVLANKAKIAALRVDAGLDKELLAMERTTSQRQQDNAATLSQIAAQRELNDTVQQYQRALDAMGMGRAEQERLAGANQINDKYGADVRRLEDARRTAQFSGNWGEGAQKQYDDELLRIEEFKGKALTSFTDYYDQLQARQGDWRLGAQSALASYADQSSNLFAQAESLATSSFQGMEDALVSFAMTGKADFKSLANSIISDLIRIQIRAAAVSFLSSAFGALSGAGVQPSGAVTSGVSGWGNVSGTALPDFSWGGFTGPGGKYEPGGLVHKGEGVLSQEDMRALGGPTAFETLRRSLRNGFSSGGVVGATPAISRASDGSGRGSPVINIHNNVGAEVEHTTRRGAGGEEIFDFFVNKAVETVAGQIAGDYGVNGQAMRQRAQMGM